MARLVGIEDGRYHRSDHGAAPCGAEARRPSARETERLRPCPKCYPPPESGLGQRKPSTRERAPEVWAALMARSGGRCEVRGPGCWGQPVVPHHRLRQAHGTVDTVANIVMVCEFDHTIGPESIHRMGAKAYEVGLLIRREDGPPGESWRRE